MRATENRICSISADTNSFWLLKEVLPNCATDMIDEYFFVRVFPGQDLTLLITKKCEYRFWDYVRMGRLLLTFGNDTLSVFV
jgi:hypothetical protein